MTAKDTVDAISITNLNKNYGELKAVNNLNLSIPKGSFLGFLGPNGAGKSTTIHMVTGLCTPSSGSIKIFDQDIAEHYLWSRKQIGLAPQEFNFDRFFTVSKILEFQAGYFGMPRKEAKQRTEHILNDLDLWDKRDEKATKLSGGMKRRLLMGKAMVHDPNILILDEPTAGVDVELRHKFWDYLRALNAKGKTIILTTHYIEEAQELCEDIAFINHGQLIQKSKKADLIQSGQSLEQVFLDITKDKNASQQLKTGL